MKTVTKGRADSMRGLDTDYKDKEIWLYKAHSRGEVVGIYQSIRDIVEVEKLFNPLFAPASIYSSLNGKTKHFQSNNHQCKVKPVLKPKSVQ